MTGYTISETFNNDILLATKIDCVACDSGLGNYSRQNCGHHCRRLNRCRSLIRVVGTIVNVISPVIGVFIGVVISTNVSSIIILVPGAAT